MDLKPAPRYPQDLIHQNEGEPYDSPILRPETISIALQSGCKYKSIFLIKNLFKGNFGNYF